MSLFVGGFDGEEIKVVQKELERHGLGGIKVVTATESAGVLTPSISLFKVSESGQIRVVSSMHGKFGGAPVTGHLGSAITEALKQVGIEGKV